MKITFDNEFEYIPFFNDNREDEKPGVAKFRYMTTPERVKFITVENVFVKGRLERHTTFDREGIVRVSLLSLENFDVNGVKIKTAQELISYQGLSTLTEELGDYAAGKNITPDLKN